MAEVLAAFEVRQAILEAATRGFALPLALRGEVEQRFVLAQAMTTGLELAFHAPLALLERDPVELGFDFVQALPDATPVVVAMPRLVLADGREIELLSLDIQCDEGAHCLSFSLALAEAADWTALEGQAATLAVGGVDYALILEEPTREASFASEVLELQGRSPACRLEQPYAEPVTRTWTNVLARSLCQELADAAGVTLVWEILNWRIERHAAEAADPIDILREITTDAAMLVSRPDGALVARWRYPRSPSRWAAATPALTIDDWNHILELSESLQPRQGYREVVVTDAEAEQESLLQLALWDEETGQELAANQHALACFLSPWTADPVLRHAGGADVAILPLGLVEEERNEEVQFVQGAASTSYPVLDVVSVAWNAADLGAVTPEGATGLRAEVAGQSLATVAYATRLYLWLVTGDPGQVLFWVEV